MLYLDKYAREVTSSAGVPANLIEYKPLAMDQIGEGNASGWMRFTVTGTTDDGAKVLVRESALAFRCVGGAAILMTPTGIAVPGDLDESAGGDTSAWLLQWSVDNDVPGDPTIYLTAESTDAGETILWSVTGDGTTHYLPAFVTPP